ncbi:MAG TPA: T9SS type A sorting domain-containing protein, partial [Bacteroidia bacterium]|nr:T9SS type A sorting domain-containing protein [Bacteroidia bacterium]HMY14093.1 T9SS type A sorting domain-containing protein [Bacteroidia bacterium]HNF40582.1 T9SS type A sorting domain-containing protein [Bacteroidia bacterium]HNN10777.1 T9SS type A sorting domain-containing protein [Bacteroidia bacterium]
LISVYPNPIGNEMHLRMLLKESSLTVLIILKDVAGKEVGKWVKKVFPDEDDITLDVSFLSNGIYYLCVTSDNLHWNGVVLKQKNQ